MFRVTEVIEDPASGALTVAGQEVPVVNFSAFPDVDDLPAQHALRGHDAVHELVKSAPELWNTYEIPESLLERVVREGEESDVILGNRPERCSPLGRVDYAALGSVTADEDLYSSLPDLRLEYVEDARVRVVHPPTTSDIEAVRYNPLIELTTDPAAKTLCALVLGSRSFAAPLPNSWWNGPAGALVKVDYDLFGRYARQELRAVRRWLQDRLPGGKIGMSLLWRAYIGGNTDVLDASTPMRRSTALVRVTSRLHGVVHGGGVLVGRLVLTVHRGGRKPGSDFTARRRRLRMERAYEEATAWALDVRQVTIDDNVAPVAPRDAVILVHGTMSCSVPIAEQLRPIIPDGFTVLRYEHDTWLEIQANAKELAAEMQRLGLHRVLFVAHSRGGLVARHAADVLRDESPDITTHLIAAGTPFLGTPVAGIAEAGSLGMKALSGLVRTAGGPMIDYGTRLAGLMLRLEQPPAGIKEMDPESPYLSGFIRQPLQAASPISGVADGSFDIDRYGLIFLSGLSGELFPGVPNDYVVGADSSLGRIGIPPALRIETDHFGYFESAEARAFIRDAVTSHLRATWPQTFSRRDNQDQ